MQDGVVLNAGWIAALVVHYRSAVQRHGDLSSLVILAPLKLSDTASGPEFVGSSASALNHKIKCHSFALEIAQAVADLLCDHLGEGVGCIGNSPVRSLDHGLAGQLFLDALVFGADVVSGACLGCKHVFA